MKVKDLIEELNKVDQELDVEIATITLETGIAGIEITDRLNKGMNCVRLVPEHGLIDTSMLG